MDSLLFVDDEKNILKINQAYFEERGFMVLTAESSQEALSLLKQHSVSCLILDILMPGDDGFDLCKEIRQQQDIPIIFLTNLSEKDFLYRGFAYGGDDYMTKPYDLLELELRITASIKRRKGLFSPLQKLSFPPLTIDALSRSVTVSNSLVPLTSYEFDILYLLASSYDTVFSPESIYREIWKLPDLHKVKTVQVHVARMRHKLEEAFPAHSFVETVWKKGYKFIPY